MATPPGSLNGLTIVLNSLKKYIADFFPLVVFRRLKKSLRDIIDERHEKLSGRNQVVCLHPKGPVRGRVLVSYIIDGFLLAPGEQIPKTHTNIWMSVKIAQTFQELGYIVDFIHYTNRNFVPEKEYAVLVDVRHNMERLAPLLNTDCIKIMHIDAAHMLFHNAAEAGRLLALQQRRGITLRPQRFEMPNYCIEHADYATATGNEFTINTFNYANTPIFRLPTPCGILMDLPARDVDQCRRHFMWFSSSGSVHKGLDLALETFATLPDLHLTVCGPIEKDQAFSNAYHKELYETENIRTIGWIDVDGDAFADIARSCCAVLHLSCSEGGAPSVKMCMHAGLIPIVSYESGVDVEAFGYCLTDCTIENITRIVREVASLPSAAMTEKWHGAWNYARKHHTREHFSSVYRQTMSQIIADAGSKKT